MTPFVFPLAEAPDAMRYLAMAWQPPVKQPDIKAALAKLKRYAI